MLFYVFNLDSLQTLFGQLIHFFFFSRLPAAHGQFRAATWQTHVGQRGEPPSGDQSGPIFLGAPKGGESHERITFMFW